MEEEYRNYSPMCVPFVYYLSTSIFTEILSYVRKYVVVMYGATFVHNYISTIVRYTYIHTDRTEVRTEVLRSVGRATTYVYSCTRTSLFVPYYYFRKYDTKVLSYCTYT